MQCITDLVVGRMFVWWAWHSVVVQVAGQAELSQLHGTLLLPMGWTEAALVMTYESTTKNMLTLLYLVL